MVSRTTEFVHDVNAQMKGAERAQEFLAAQKNSEVEHDKNSIAKAEESPEVELHLENEGGDGSEAYSGQQKKDAPVESEYMSLLDSDVGPSEHTIDMLL